jgi:hypothetical protein
MRFKAGLAVAAVALLGSAFVGCSADSTSSSSSSSSLPSTSTSTTTTADAVCSDKTTLQASVKTLTDPNTLKGGRSSITSAADQVKTNLDALGKSVQADLQPKVSAVRSAVQEVETSAGNLGNGSTADNLESIGNAIATVGTTAGDLANSLAPRCPSS